MKFKNLLPLLFLVLTLMMSACGEKDNTEATVVPGAELTLSHSFAYDNNTQNNKTQTPAELKAQATSSETEFYFYAGNQNKIGRDATGDDHVNFKIPAANLRPGFIGKYALKSLPNTATSEASIYYVHYTSNSGGSMYDSQWNTLEGNFEITAYDNANKLVSGNYTFTLKQVYDPYTADTGYPNRKKVDINVSGTFKNVKIN